MCIRDRDRIEAKIEKGAKLDGKYIKSMNQYRKNVKRINMITKQQLSNTMLHIASYGMEFQDGNCS